MFFCVVANFILFLFSGPDEGQVARAKVLTEDLLLVVRQEHAKMQTVLQQQQMELHQAQAQYAAYSAMSVSTFKLCFYLRPHRYNQGYAPPPPSGPVPPAPPGEGPPPAPAGTPAGDAAAAAAAANGSAQYAGAAAPPAPTDTEAYLAYWYVFFL